MVTSRFFFFKMLLLQQFMSELDDTWTQCSTTWCIYMVLMNSRPGSYDINDDVITYNHCRNFGAKYLGNDARYRDSFNVQPIGTSLWAIDCACSWWRHVTRWRHNGVALFSLTCFFSGNSGQNWTILEHNVPLYGMTIWSSWIVDAGLMTSLMTSSHIIIVATLGLNISETRPDSGMVSTYSE